MAANQVVLVEDVDCPLGNERPSGKKQLDTEDSYGLRSVLGASRLVGIKYFMTLRQSNKEPEYRERQP